MSEDRGPTRDSGYWTPARIAVAAAIVAVAAWVVFRGSQIVAYTLARLANVVMTLVLSVAVASVIWPAVVAVEGLMPFLGPRTRRVVSGLVVILTFVVAVVALVVVTVVPVLDELKRLGGMLQSWLAQLPDELDRLARVFEKYASPDVIEVIRQKVLDWVTGLFAAQGQLFRGLVVRGWAIVELLIVPVLAFYFVTDGAMLAEQFIAGLAPSRRERIRAMGAEMNALLHSYVRAQVVLCFLMFAATSLILLLAGVRVYLTLGLVAGLGWAVPILGPVVAAVPIVIICLMQRGLEITGAVLASYIGLNLLQTKVIMPRVLAGSARLHPVYIIVALLVGAEFLGILGLFVAVPAAAVLRVLIVHLRPSGR